MASDEYKYLGYAGTCVIINTMAICRCSINGNINDLISDIEQLISNANSLIDNINEKFSANLTKISISIESTETKSTTRTEISGSDKINYYLGESGSNYLITTLAGCRTTLDSVFDTLKDDLSDIITIISDIIDELESLNVETSSLSKTLSSIETSLNN